MTDLDDLKDAMHSPPDFEPRPLDLGAVMAAGGRLRRRRRLAVAATSAAAVLVLLVGGSQLTRLGGEDHGTGPARPQVAAARPSGPVSAEPTGDVLGDVIATGLTTSTGEPVVLWFKPIDDEAIPGTSFGLTVGRRTAGGALKSEVLTNESEGSDKAPGFHATEAPMEVDGFDSPAFGYYSGAHAARITVLADGHRVDASLAPWSGDPSIIAFWFDPAQVAPGARLTKLTAYDADGKALPGHGTGFAVG
ncbi:hypothetical protein [Actinoplanes sp. NPDC049681]|uniref:hypothetical protein n=1 Tax=Actinoplanes sp. NPDC049681 TaxID=3363905 RepID=UPI0037A9BD2F